MSCSRFFFACLVALPFATGCDNNTNVGPLVPFSRPEHVAFACYAQKVGTSGDNTEWDVLPQACCATNPATECTATKQADGTYVPHRMAPHLHALVTQSTRGEVAAVDMELNASDRVLDSDSLIPGYTFLNSGGLPSAVVMPAKQPRGDAAQGAQFAFVASAEEYQVHAIAACRFRSGRGCGPERKDASLPARLTIPLPGAPGDMILGPDEALWITLPEQALIARVELADPASAPNDAFALDANTGLPKMPQFFRVPETTVAEPPEPIAERPSYAEICGLTNAYQQEAVALPIAPRAPMAPIRPKLLRYDGASGILLVADAAAPAIHAFALGADGTLTARGALPTGAPIRDFALTAPVPAEVPRDGSGQPAALAPAAVAALPSARYVYAIDDRDGSVMVFGYEATGGAARLTPLLAPAPTSRFADRIDTAQPVNALDIIDTRGSATGDLSCGAEYDSARGTQQDYDAGMEAIRKSAGGGSLRGVFVSLIAENGTIALLDVYDLDLRCRVDLDCNYKGGDAKEPLRPDVRASVAVRRHSARRLTASQLLAGTTNDPLFDNVTAESCQPYTPVANTTKVCAPTDPWYMVSDTYAVQYQASLPGATSPSGSLDLGAAGPTALGEDEVVLKAPLGLDLCGRGVQPDDRVALTYPTTNVTKRAQNDTCSDVGGEDDNALLTVTRAYRDRLVLRRPANATLDRLLQCFPDFVNFDVRSSGFLVLGSTYFNNVIADADGACVIDATRPQLTSRAKPGERYLNPYVSFQLAGNAVDLAARSATVTLTQGSTPLSATLVTGTFADVEPATVRYYPGLNQLFVVDSASTGLSRYALNPFARDD